MLKLMVFWYHIDIKIKIWDKTSRSTYHIKINNLNFARQFSFYNYTIYNHYTIFYFLSETMVDVFSQLNQSFFILDFVLYFYEQVLGFLCQQNQCMKFLWSPLANKYQKHVGLWDQQMINI